MKKLSFILILTFFSLIAFAQNERYTQGMTKAIAMIDTASAVTTFQQAANILERIAAAEKDEWLPNYYQAYCQVRMALPYMGQDQEKMIAHIEKAQVALDAAMASTTENSELLSLQGYIYHLHVWSNPQVNGPKYVPQANEVLQKAISLDDSNPRPYHLLGQNLFFTPEFWGGGAEAALPFLQEADERYASFKPASSISPNWGKDWNTDLLSRAQP
jgi:tetratricopeptide (TPR) repeat protein